MKAIKCEISKPLSNILPNTKHRHAVQIANCAQAHIGIAQTAQQAHIGIAQIAHRPILAFSKKKVATGVIKNTSGQLPLERYLTSWKKARPNDKSVQI